MDLTKFIDPVALPFTIVTIAFGVMYKGWKPKHEWATRIKDCIPIPVVLATSSIVLCLIIGYLVGVAEGEQWIPFELFRYGVGNGISIAFIAIFLYDTIHGIEKYYKKEKKK